MKKNPRHITLEHNECLVTGYDSDGKDLEVFFKGKKVLNVKGIIFIKGCNTAFGGK